MSTSTGIELQFTLDSVLQHINELYYSADSKTKQAADRYLVEFQKHPSEAMGIAEQLLQHPDVVVQLMGAQTLYKCVRQLQFSPEDCLRQASGLLRALATLEQNADSRVRNQLGCTLAGLLVRVPDVNFEVFLSALLADLAWLTPNPLGSRDDLLQLRSFRHREGYSVRLVAEGGDCVVATSVLLEVLAALPAEVKSVGGTKDTKVALLRKRYHFGILTFAALHVNQGAGVSSTPGGPPAASQLFQDGGSSSSSSTSRAATTRVDGEQSPSTSTLRARCLQVFDKFSNELKVGIFEAACVVEAVSGFLGNDPFAIDVLIDGLQTSSIGMVLWDDAKQNMNVFVESEGAALEALLMFLKDVAPGMLARYYEKHGGEQRAESADDGEVRILQAVARALAMLGENFTQLFYDPNCAGFLLPLIAEMFRRFPFLAQELEGLFIHLKELGREERLSNEQIRQILQEFTEPCIQGLFASCCRRRPGTTSTGSSVAPVLSEFLEDDDEDCVPPLPMRRQSGKELVKDLFDMWFPLDLRSAASLLELFAGRIDQAVRESDLWTVEMLYVLSEGFLESDFIQDVDEERGVNADLKILVKKLCSAEVDFVSLGAAAVASAGGVDKQSGGGVARRAGSPERGVVGRRRRASSGGWIGGEGIQDLVQEAVAAAVCSVTAVAIKFLPLLNEEVRNKEASCLESAVLRASSTGAGGLDAPLLAELGNMAMGLDHGVNNKDAEPPESVPEMIDFLVRNLRWAAHPCASTLEQVLGYFGEMVAVRRTFDVLIRSIDEFALSVLVGQGPNVPSLHTKQNFLETDTALYGAACCLVRADQISDPVAFIARFHRLLFSTFTLLDWLRPAILGQEGASGGNGGQRTIEQEVCGFADGFLKQVLSVAAASGYGLASTSLVQQQSPQDMADKYLYEGYGLKSSVTGTPPDPKFIAMLLLHRLQRVLFLVTQIENPNREVVATAVLSSLCQTLTAAAKPPVDQDLYVQTGASNTNLCSFLDMLVKLSSLPVEEIFFSDLEHNLADFKEADIDVYIANAAVRLWSQLFQQLASSSRAIFSFSLVILAPADNNTQTPSGAGPLAAGAPLLHLSSLETALARFLGVGVANIAHPILILQILTSFVKAGGVQSALLEHTVLQIWLQRVLPQLQNLTPSAQNPKHLVPIFELTQYWVLQAHPDQRMLEGLSVGRVNRRGLAEWATISAGGGPQQQVGAAGTNGSVLHDPAGGEQSPLYRPNLGAPGQAWIELVLVRIYNFLETDYTVRSQHAQPASPKAVSSSGSGATTTMPASYAEAARTSTTTRMTTSAGISSQFAVHQLQRALDENEATRGSKFAIVYQSYSLVNIVYKNCLNTLHLVLASYAELLADETVARLSQLCLTTYHAWPSATGTKRGAVFDLLRSHARYQPVFLQVLQRYLADSQDLWAVGGMMVRTRSSVEGGSSSFSDSLPLQQKVPPARRELVYNCFRLLEGRKFYIFLQDSSKTPWNDDDLVKYEDHLAHGPGVVQIVS